MPIISCAKKSIPRGQVVDYKPFWNEKLEALTTKRNDATKLLENTSSPENKQHLNNTQDELETEIKKSKKDRFEDDLKHLDYRTNASHTHRRISTINEKILQRSNEAIKHNNKLLTSNKTKCKQFLKHYVKVSNENSKIRKIDRNPENRQK